LQFAGWHTSTSLGTLFSRAAPESGIKKKEAAEYLRRVHFFISFCVFGARGFQLPLKFEICQLTKNFLKIVEKEQQKNF